MKKNLMFVALTLATMTLAACGGNNKPKAGLITLHDENSTYDKNFIDAFKAACKKMGYAPVIKTGVKEDVNAQTAAENLADQGCKFVFADSFGHEPHILAASKKYTNVEFAHATGTQAHTANQANFHNAFASIYEGRYLAGVAAGLKLQSMTGKAHKLGYVGAFTYAEVISGLTSWYLGVKSVVEDVTMDVTFTGSWYNEADEKSAAESLIAGGATIISQHADSWGAPTACETAGVPNITYNGSTESRCPNTYVISSKIDWAPYFEKALGAISEGKSFDVDYSGGLGSALDNGSVSLSAAGKKGAAEGTEAKLNEVAAELRAGTRKVFDCSKFTVTAAKLADKDGNITVDETGHLTQYKADVDDNKVNGNSDYVHDKEVVKSANGITYFAESEFRSAPYFDIQIDGINFTNAKY